MLIDVILASIGTFLSFLGLLLGWKINPTPTHMTPDVKRNKIAVFRFQSDLITKQNNEDTNKVLFNCSGNGFRAGNELGVFS